MNGSEIIQLIMNTTPAVLNSEPAGAFIKNISGSRYGDFEYIGDIWNFRNESAK